VGIKDVALSSTQGKSPMADKLNGGDYDEDRCWIFWKESLVKNFKNSPEPSHFGSAEEDISLKMQPLTWR
jgi:hypothetical protein